MQSLLLIAAIIAFSIFSLTANKRILEQRSTAFNSEAQIAGIGYAQQLVEQISSYSFDETTTNSQTVSAPSELTASGSFGYEGGETIPDDIDDYHGQTFSFDSQRMEGFEANIIIKYADTTDPQLDTTSKTYLKRIKVIIKNTKFMSDSLVYQQVVAYY